QWLRDRRTASRPQGKPSRRPKAPKLLVELLEDRTLPSTVGFGLYNTAVDVAGSVLADGSVDPHYTLTQSADAGAPGPNAFVVNQPLPGGWLADNASSKWIAPSANQNGGGNAPGNYTYRTTFNLPSFIDATTARIGGQWAADDTGTAILLNGTDI